MAVVPGVYRYVLANWEWRADDDNPEFVSWKPPLGAVGALDLRPLPAMGRGAPEGFGFFALDRAADIPKGALLLGDDIHASLNAPTRAGAVSAGECLGFADPTRRPLRREQGAAAHARR